MSAAGSAATPSSLDDVRSLLTRSTQHLLGATIDLDDDRWRSESRCPGWTRGHLATHLARNADAVGRLCHWAATGERREMYASAETRDAEIESGAGRPGLELQVDLDTSAGRLDAGFAAIDEENAWDALVEARGRPMPARLLPLVRLFEVAMHHIDLDLGFGIADLDEETTGWLLEFVALRLQGRDDVPALVLTTETGYHAVVGRSGEPTTVSGPAGSLLGWLTGRGGPDGLTGTDGISVPAFS